MKNVQIDKLPINEIEKLYDVACKRVLSYKAVLAFILKCVVSEYKDASIPVIMSCIETDPLIDQESVFRESIKEVIKGSNVEDATVSEGKITFDIVFSARVPNSEKYIGLQFNIESQNRGNLHYPMVSRGIFYASRKLSMQKDTIFIKDHYEDLEKVYSIWIIFDPKKRFRNTISEFRIEKVNLYGDAEYPRIDYDLIDVILVQMGKSNINIDNELLDFLYLLYSTEYTRKEKFEHLENQYGLRFSESQQKEVEDMGAFSEHVLFEGYRKGMAQGIEQGRQEGKLEGILESQLELVLRTMKLEGSTFEKALTKFPFSAEETQAIRKFQAKRNKESAR